MKLSNNYAIKSFILFAFLFMGSICITLYVYAYIVNNVIKERFIKTANATHNYYYKQVIAQNLGGFDIVNNFDYHQWSDEPRYLNLMIESLKFFNGTEAIDIKLRNTRGTIILSLDPIGVENGQFNEFQHHNEFLYFIDKVAAFLYPEHFADIGFESSLLGATQSTIIPYASFRNSEGLMTHGVIAKIIMPVIDESRVTHSPILGVVELYFDMSFGWDKAHNIAALVMCALAALLFFVGLHLMQLYRRFQNVVGLMMKAHNDLALSEKAALEEVQRKTIFLSAISHEIKTPIASIAGYSEAMLNEQVGPINNPIYKQYIEDINNISSYSLALIKDILDYARATTNQLIIDYVCFDVRKVLIFCTKMLELRANQFGLKIKLDLSAESLPIMADQKRFKQCVLNILTNSIKYTPSGGEIRICADIDKSMKFDQVRIIFEDTGIGIDSKDLAKSSANFEKIEAVQSTKYEGTGLGLPFTRKLIELMGGKFYIESQLGKGTKISFVFKFQDHI